MASKNNKFSLSSIFAVLGFVLLFFIAVWSAVQVVKFAPRAFESLPFPSFAKSGIEITNKESKMESGEEFKLTWNLTGANGGVLSFIYACKDSVVFDVYDLQSKSFLTLPCGSPYNMPPSQKELTIKAHELKERNSEAALAIVYVNKSGKKFKDVLPILISDKSKNSQAQNIFNKEESDKEKKEKNKPSKSESKTKKTNTKSAVSKKRNDACVSKVFGTPNLKITSLQSGVILPSGQFAAKSIFASNETLVLRFYVSNNGDKSSPEWFFRMLTPTESGYIYSSQTQPSIAPCSGRIYTVSIDSLSLGQKTLQVSVDPDNLIKEKNEFDNNASLTITVY